MILMNLFMKQTHRHKRHMHGYQRGKEVGGGINSEFWISRYKLLSIK